MALKQAAARLDLTPQEKWVLYRGAKLPHLKNHTNNRLESFFGKLKGGLPGATSMATMLSELVTCDRRQRKEAAGAEQVVCLSPLAPIFVYNESASTKDDDFDENDATEWATSAQRYKRALLSTNLIASDLAEYANEKEFKEFEAHLLSGATSDRGSDDRREACLQYRPSANPMALKQAAARLDLTPQEKWVLYRGAKLPHLKNHTNNRLESFFGKLKGGLPGATSMATMLSELVTCDRRQRKEAAGAEQVVCLSPLAPIFVYNESASTKDDDFDENDATEWATSAQRYKRALLSTNLIASDLAEYANEKEFKEFEAHLLSGATSDRGSDDVSNSDFEDPPAPASFTIRLNPVAKKTGRPVLDKAKKTSDARQQRLFFNKAERARRNLGEVTLEDVLASLEKEQPAISTALERLKVIPTKFGAEESRRPKFERQKNPVLNIDAFYLLPKKLLNAAMKVLLLQNDVNNAIWISSQSQSQSSVDGEATRQDDVRYVARMIAGSFPNAVIPDLGCADYVISSLYRFQPPRQFNDAILRDVCDRIQQVYPGARHAGMPSGDAASSQEMDDKIALPTMMPGSIETVSDWCHVYGARMIDNLADGRERWSGAEELFGIVWYLREPLFVIGEDAHVQVYMIDQAVATDTADERMYIHLPTQEEA
ncbi:hypothetical protein ATCC90586_007255 [Pythium insidiosum]|nr:hypothetical protein ATCC90586_007255 [Pythium insidiosum]